MDNYGLVYYADPKTQEEIEFIATHYMYGISGLKKVHYANKQEDILAINPDFKWFGYETSDTATGSSIKLALMQQYAQEEGITLEDLFQHYSEVTEVKFNNVVTALQPNSRVPVYNLNRFVWNLSTPEARRVYLRVFLEEFAQREYSQAGMFIDNCAFPIQGLWNTMVQSGGMVAEANAIMGSTAYANWYLGHLCEFLSMLRTELNNLGYKLCINIANSWKDMIVENHVADILFQEWQYTPSIAKKAGRTWAIDAFNRTKMAYDAGIQCFFMSRYQNIDGETNKESIDRNLAMYALAKAPNTIFGCQNEFDLSIDNWISRSWSDTMLNLKGKLGNRTTPTPVQLETSPDSGFWIQTFEHGSASVFTVDWNGDLDQEIAGLKPGQAKLEIVQQTFPVFNEKAAIRQWRGKYHTNEYETDRFVDMVVEHGGPAGLPTEVVDTFVSAAINRALRDQYTYHSDEWWTRHLQYIKSVSFADETLAQVSGW